MHNQVIPQMTTVEVGPEGEDKALTKALEDRGHEVLLFDINMAVAESKSCFACWSCRC